MDETISIYAEKQNIANDGETIAHAIVHPICLIEEQARRGRIWAWFSPPIPPTITLIAEIEAMMECEEGSMRRISRSIGATFKIVDKIQHINHGIQTIIEGNQK